MLSHFKGLEMSDRNLIKCNNLTELLLIDVAALRKGLSSSLFQQVLIRHRMKRILNDFQNLTIYC